ncbi:MAG TPA: adenylate/guanylate cyclase domain-containing protein [Actinomycetota bacterium]|nr:adenylate/guanylate cyclase domain-containing protein [Actinomycetota bacterium]
MNAELPTGTVTFLFTDIEGSTKLLQRLGDRYEDVVQNHGRILRDAIAAGGGVQRGTEGDSFFAVFPTAQGALTAVIQAQRALAAADWPNGETVSVRMGVHTGQGIRGGDDYIGIDVHRAARIAAAGHGGQVLISEGTRGLVELTLPPEVSLRDLGTHRLKDIEHPEHLYQLVIQGLPDEFPPIRTLDARPTNLPSQRTSFVGRDAEAAEIGRLFPEARLVTLTGPGGTGKTRLAIRVATDQLVRFKDGAFMVDLSPITEPALVPSAIAAALQVREEPGRGVLDTVIDHLRDREMLLFLDNFEQIVPAAEVVDRILSSCPQVCVLVTSRVPLHLSGEQEFPVPPLDSPDPTRIADLTAFSQYEAVALFIDRAAAVRPDFQVTNQNAPAVAEITARLDGLPLAIELAATRVKLLTPEALLARLGQRLPLLTGGARDLPERQRTLRAAIEWSHELLDPDERRLFARLAVFSGGWTLDTAEAVCASGLDLPILDGLASLVDKSLVRQEEIGAGEPRFRMLETIREYAADRLANSEEREALRRRHAEYFRDLAEEAEPHFIGEQQIKWLDEFEAEHDNVRAALQWAVENNEAETALRTGAAIWRFWQQRGHLAEGQSWLSRLVSLPAAAKRAGPRARALIALGSVAYWHGDYESMRFAYREAEEIARELEDPGLLAHAVYNLSFVPALDRDLEAARALLQESLGLATEAGDRRLVAEIKAGFGMFALLGGDAAGAIPPLEEAIAIQREISERFLIADNLTGLAAANRQIGKVDEADRLMREALRTFRETMDPSSFPGTIWGLAMIASDRGLYERAARLVGVSTHAREEAGGGAPPEFLVSIGGGPEDEARQALGDEEYERAYAAGYAMTVEEGVSYALEERD